MTEPEFQFYDLHATVLVEEGGNVYEEVLTPPVCDFCMDTRVRWEYACERFSIGSFGSDGGWLACDRCSALIEAGQKRMLTERSLESWRVRGNPAMKDAGKSLRIMQAAFFRHRQGERQAFG